MTHGRPSRRDVLKRLASAGVIGALGSLRSRALFAARGDSPPPGGIAGVQGKVIRRHDEDYEIWRQSMVWHKSKPARYPDMIVQPRTEREVMAAVKFAAENKLKVATRSGGHSATGASLRDGGMLIDLSALNAIEVDPSSRIASVQPAARSLQLLTRAREQGLSFPVPHCPSVGLGGFVLGGGIGWNYAHRGGIASFSINGADLVMADGSPVRARADRHSDLLWAVRGGGPGLFCVVTRLYLELYAAPQAILASSYIHPLEGLTDVTRALDELMAVKDARVEVLALLLHSPDAPPNAPPEASKICFVSVFAFADTTDEARALLAPFAGSAVATRSVVKVENQPFSYEALYAKFFSLDVSAGRMARYAVDNVITDDAGGALGVLADHFRRTPSPYNHVLAAYGMNLEPRDDACFSSIGKHYVGCFAVWDREEDDALNFPWLDQTLPLMDPFAKGHYVNEVEARLHPERIRRCFSDASWKRLRDLRRQYDPDGVFHDYLGHA